MIEGKTKILLVAFIVTAAVGFLDASFLTIEHYRESIPPCIATSGCETVLTSKYNNLFGVPTALLGALYYLALLIASVFALDRGNARVMRVASLATVVGIAMSAYFVSLQLFVIKAICFYCMVSAASSTALFLIGSIILFLTRRRGSLFKTA